jgi:DNA-binding transcriptional LysR family regulator
LVMDSQRVLATDIHAVWPQTRHLSSKVRAAIDALAAEIPAMIAYPTR